jgi:hypothetical protein
VFNVADIALTFAALTILQRGWKGATMDGGTDGDHSETGGDAVRDS